MIRCCRGNSRRVGLPLLSRHVCRGSGWGSRGNKGRSYGRYLRRIERGSHGRMQSRYKCRRNRRVFGRIKSRNQSRPVSRCLRRVTRGCGSWNECGDCRGCERRNLGRRGGRHICRNFCGCVGRRVRWLICRRRQSRGHLSGNLSRVVRGNLRGYIGRGQSREHSRNVRG
jgi:hypothetical protein